MDIDTPDSPGVAPASPSSEDAAIGVFVPAPPAKPRTSLAKRISSRTTDFLAIAIVLIGSLTLGRQILEWWRADPPAVMDEGPLVDLGTEWGADGKPVELEFADSPFRLTRQTVAQGGPNAAIAVVQEACQKALLHAQPLELPPDQTERDLLQTVSERQPEVEQPGLWQVHRLGGNMTTLVGIRFFPASEKNSDAPHPPPVARVVCWGLIFPGGSFGSWTAYTFVKTNSESSTGTKPSTDGTAADFDLSKLSLPEGCRRTISVRETSWNCLLGFQGRGSAAEWREHFSRWFESNGWTVMEDWEGTDEGRGWSASFTQADESNDSNSNPNRILIQLQFTASGHGSGLIHGLPGRPTSPNAEGNK